MFAAPVNGTKPLPGVTPRARRPAGSLMKTCPDTTRATTDLPGTGGAGGGAVCVGGTRDGCEIVCGTTVNVSGPLRPLMPWALACVACAVYVPGASAPVTTDHEVPDRGAESVWRGVSRGTSPL